LWTSSDGGDAEAGPAGDAPKEEKSAEAPATSESAEKSEAAPAS
jgi:hypothetical protein